ncbi:MAG: [FeFe] hydrogenase H-cluster maturation GTPase HydF [Desulfohalobiaceae bacterium]|nr:[FeFe] hydrogenase H-cluster maturation GTPase HydF [Desulfohalobiaceae bacterium]
MHRTPKGLRLHIGLFGRRNAGKSSLLNAMTRQQVSIVSEKAGTTTDAVEKAMELLPLGPVQFIDTAGLDDQGSLGSLRVQATLRVLQRIDIGVLVTESGIWGSIEDTILQKLRKQAIPVLVVFNKADLAEPDPAAIKLLAAQQIPTVQTSADRGKGILEFRQALLNSAPEAYLHKTSIIGDLLRPGDMAVLVVPIDKEAPKGRLILPQVQTIRDLLDHNAFCTVVRENELKICLQNLTRPPRIVVTDSQAFQRVAADTPRSIPLTSFSILFARFKGDLSQLVLGALAIDRLKSGDLILMAEACSHHPIQDDIGRVKIPRWLQQYVGGPLRFATVQGHDFPDDLSSYNLIVHCGACMQNRREMLNKILQAQKAGVPITNYGLTIAHSLGILDRALEPFPGALEAF